MSELRPIWGYVRSDPYLLEYTRKWRSEPRRALFESSALYVLKARESSSVLGCKQLLFSQDPFYVFFGAHFQEHSQSLVKKGVGFFSVTLPIPFQKHSSIFTKNHSGARCCTGFPGLNDLTQLKEKHSYNYNGFHYNSHRN